MPDSNQQKTFDATTAQEKRQLVQNNFGAAAADYVTSAVHAKGPDLDWIVEVASLNGTEQVLDVGTGGGHTAFALAPHAAEVVALDITQEMLAVAQQEAIRRNLLNIRFLAGDAQASPCEDNSFDVVACRKAAHHFPQVQQAVQEWARLLKPGGQLLLVDSISPEDDSADAFLHEIEILRDPSHVRNHRLSEWILYLKQAGFTVNSTREWRIHLDIQDWTQRMRTPADSVAEITHRLRTASPTIQEHLGINEPDGKLAFLLPTAMVVATKTAAL